MPEHDLRYPPSGDADSEAASSEVEAFAVALHEPRYGTAAEPGAAVPADDVARDLAEIARASAALRKAEPALETWCDPPPAGWSDDAPAAALRKPRPVWLLIGLLWLSTALVTAGAVAAIARLAGS
jgi:hypothetical protein